MRDKLLGWLTLTPLAGYRSYIAAAGLVGLAVYEFSRGNFEAGFASLMAGLATLGIRGAVPAKPAALLLAVGGALALTPSPAAAGDALFYPPVLPGARDVTAEVLAGTPDWGHAHIGVPAAWLVTKGKGITVAVLDTGCDLLHPALVGRVDAAADFTGGNDPTDRNGHGTHCAGTIGAAEDSPRPGVAPHCRLLIAKVLTDSGSGSSRSIAAGIRWAVAKRAHVISMSLGSGSEAPDISAAIREALAAGVAVVAAAGNEGPGEGTVGWPASTPGVQCVAAVGKDGRAARFSSRGRRVDVATPGVDVVAPAPGGRYVSMSGTSMATPYQAGVCALTLSARTSAFLRTTPAELHALVTAAAADIVPAGKDTATGHGLSQPAKLVAGGTAPPPPPPAVKLTFTLAQWFGPEGRRLMGMVERVERIEVTLTPEGK